MKPPTLWVDSLGEFRCRVEIRLVTTAGSLLKSKTWEIHRHKADPVRHCCLQFHGQLAENRPEFSQPGENYFVFTLKVSEFAGELHITVVAGQDSKLLGQTLARFPATFVVLVSERLDFQLHLAKSKSA